MEVVKDDSATITNAETKEQVAPPKVQPVFGRFTNKDLMNFNNEILSWRGSVLYWFMRGKINQFHKDNNVRFQSLADKIQEAQHVHFEFDGDKVKTILVKGENDVETEQVVCNEGFTMEMYDKWYQNFMEQDCTIEI